MRFFLALLLASPSPFAAAEPTESLRAWPLQFHCGVQAFEGDGYLAYGLLVYRFEGGTEIAHFERRGPSPENHPFCLRIRESMQEGQSLYLEVHRHGSWTELSGLTI